VIIPLVDYLELGEEARFNIPSTLGNNWVWRMDESDLTEELQERILKNTKTYKR
jgi:4-alpha-glucanotransferase